MWHHMTLFIAWSRLSTGVTSHDTPSESVSDSVTQINLVSSAIVDQHQWHFHWETRYWRQRSTKNTTFITQETTQLWWFWNKTITCMLCTIELKISDFFDKNVSLFFWKLAQKLQVFFSMSSLLNSTIQYLIHLD